MKIKAITHPSRRPVAREVEIGDRDPSTVGRFLVARRTGSVLDLVLDSAHATYEGALNAIRAIRRREGIGAPVGLLKRTPNLD
jgi:hypothetical protein